MTSATEFQGAELTAEELALIETFDDIDLIVHVVRDRDLVMVGWNDFTVKRTGWTKDEVIGGLAEVMFPPHMRGTLDYDALAALIRPRMEAARANPVFQRRVWTKDGRELEVWGPMFRWDSPFSDDAFWIILMSSSEELGRSVAEHVEDIVEHIHEARFSVARGEIEEEGALNYSRITVRVNDPVARAVNSLADEQGITVNALLQAMIESFAASPAIQAEYGAHDESNPMSSAAAQGFVQDVLTGVAAGVFRRARELDRLRRRRK